MRRILVAAMMLLGSAAAGARNYSLSGFTSIDASGIYEISLQKGNSWSVDVECSEDMKDRIDVRLDGKTLVLSIQNPSPGSRRSKDSYAKATITMPILSGVDLSGSCSLLCNGNFGLQKGAFHLDLSGASSVKHLRMVSSEASVVLSGAASATLTGRFDSVTGDISGSSRLGLTGTISSLHAQSSGVARFIFKDCKVSELQLEASGASVLLSDDVSTVQKADFFMTGSTAASLSVTETLNVEMAGSSCITYKGTDMLKIGKKDLSGAARLVRKQ